MGKEKKRTLVSDEKQVSLFYYEIIGIILLIFSIIVLGKMGKVGSALTILFKVCFGNWYWLLIIGFFFLGAYYLFVHKSFSIKSQRFIGFIFLYFVLLVFAHFPIHNYIISKSDSYFSSMWSIYRAFINGKYVNSLGGGIIGGTFFYVFSLLFDSFGVIVCGGLIIILSISLLINRPLVEMVKSSKGILSHLKKYASTFNNFFRYELGRNDKRKDIFSRSQKININAIKDYNNSMIVESLEKNAITNKHLINTILNNQGVYKILDVVVSYHVTTFKYYIYELKLSEFLLKLNDVFENKFMYNYFNNKLSIQIPNENYQMLTVKHLLVSQSNYLNNYNMPLALDYLNRLVEIDFEREQTSNLLIVGREEVGSFINSLLLMLFVKKNLINYQVQLFSSSLNVLSKYLIDNGKDIDAFLELLNEEIEKRYDILKANKCLDFSEYLYKAEAEMFDAEIKRFVIILDLNNLDKDYRLLFNQVSNVLQLSIKVGINIIVLVDKLDDCIFKNSFSSCFVFKVDIKTSKMLLGNDNADVLMGNGDCFYINKGHYIRCCTSLISDSQFEEYVNKLK